MHHLMFIIFVFSLFAIVITVLHADTPVTGTTDSKQLSNKNTTGNTDVKLDVVGVIASANNNGTNNSHNVVDGDLTTRWSAKDEQWIQLDLGSKQLVKRVDVAWHPGSDTRVYSFDINVLNDDVGVPDYVDIGNEGIGNSSILVNGSDGFTGNRVRLYGHGNSQNDWNSILEIAVWGSNLTAQLAQGNVTG